MNYIYQPKVAVLLAAYNGEKYIQEQIDSIKNQKGFSITIFISIDQSTDKTREICESLSNDSIIILQQTNEKFGSAGKNFYHLFREVSFQNFDCIALSDQDDIWKNDKLFCAWKKINEENIDGYSSDVECFWESGKKNKIIKKSYPQKKYDYYFEPAGPGCTYVLNYNLAISLQKNILNKNNLPFHHDWFIYAFARVNNFNWFIDDYPTIFYRQHQKNQVGANLGIKQKIKRISLLKNGVFKNHLNEILKANNITEEKLKPKIIKNPFEYRRNNKEAIILLLFTILGLI